MLLGVDRNETVDYVSKLDKEKENPTVFKLGVLTGEDRFILVAQFEENSDPKILYSIVKKGLRGIKNLKVKDESKDFEVVDNDVMELIPTRVVKELFLKLVEINYLVDKERKN